MIVVFMHFNKVKAVLFVAAVCFLAAYGLRYASASPLPGDLIKAGGASVYYVGVDNKRYVFPNDKVYFSWYKDFSGVKTVSDDELAALLIGGNVTYKPGVRLVKIQTDPKVYAVSADGVLRWVPDEVAAAAIYGTDWKKMIDDVADSFFVNYKIGTDIGPTQRYDRAQELFDASDIGTDKQLSVASSNLQNTNTKNNNNFNVPPFVPVQTSGGGGGGGGGGSAMMNTNSNSNGNSNSNANTNSNTNSNSNANTNTNGNANTNTNSNSNTPVSVDTSNSGNLFLNGFFPIGTFMPTANEFSKWKDRGINTVVGLNAWFDPAQGVTQQAADSNWDQTAKSLALKQIREPMPSPADDIGNTSLLAWAQMDEPDANGQGFINAASCSAKYSTWKSVDPTRLIYINFGGSDVMSSVDGPAPSWCPAPDYQCSLTSTYQTLIAAGDWISNDRYPVTGYLNNGATRNDLTLIAQPLEKIAGWTAKPQFNYIETSSQGFIPGARGVTPDELRAEVWLSIVHGVRGFVYFPQVVGGNNTTNDGTQDDVIVEMKKVNATVTQLAAVLQGAVNPASIHATVTAPLQAGWRTATGGKFFFVVNPAGDPVSATVSLSGIGAATSATVMNENRTVSISSGALTDQFGPFAVHIYVIP